MFNIWASFKRYQFYTVDFVISSVLKESAIQKNRPSMNRFVSIPAELSASVLRNQRLTLMNSYIIVYLYVSCYCVVLYCVVLCYYCIVRSQTTRARTVFQWVWLHNCLRQRFCGILVSLSRSNWLKRLNFLVFFPPAASALLVVLSHPCVCLSLSLSLSPSPSLSLRGSRDRL